MRHCVPAAILATFVAAAPAMAGTVKVLVNQPPEGARATMLMTDGTVLTQGFTDVKWWKLTPDNKGSYVNGTWKPVASLPSGYAPDAMAESVLADGRLIVAGGEYNFGTFSFTNQSAIYDPVKDKWTNVTPDRQLLPFIGDSPSNVLPDGRFVVGEKFKKKVFAFDPQTDTWSELASNNKHDFNAEEGWAMLRDGSFLVVDVESHPQSERYIPATGQWVDSGSTMVDLRGPQNCCGRCIPYGPKQKCYDPPGEIGASILRPDGTVFATGAIPEGDDRGHTSIYHPGTNSWTPGPDFPAGDDAYDTPATILPSGNVLVEATSRRFYEFDGTHLIDQGTGGSGVLTNLPTGEVLVGASEVYQPSGKYDAAWAPKITDYPTTVSRGSTYRIGGKQFNGVSQGGSFGDEFDSHTNYPLVRITNNATGHVFYARTHDHSTMAVQTGNKKVSTKFDVPPGAEVGASTLDVVANGIPSEAAAIMVN